MGAPPLGLRVGELLLLLSGLAGLGFGLPILQANALVGLVPMVASFFVAAFALVALVRPDEPSEPWPWPPALLLMGELLAYLALIRLIGYTLDTAGLVVAASLTVGIRRWSTIALTMAILLLVSLGVFQGLLGVALPAGSLF